MGGGVAVGAGADPPTGSAAIWPLSVPALAGTWSYDAAAKQVIVNVRQVQSGDAYRLPLEIGITTSPSAAPRVERVDVTGREAKFTFAADAEPQSVVLDPNTWLLMEPVQFAKR